MRKGGDVGIGAILVAGASSRLAEAEGVANIFAGPLEWIEIVGRSLLERIIERFCAIDVDEISVLVPISGLASLLQLRTARPRITVNVASDLRAAVGQLLMDHSQRAIHSSFIQCAPAYSETDLLDLLSFHRESRQAVTSTFNAAGPLDLWVADCAKASQTNVCHYLSPAAPNSAAKYFVGQYVNRIAAPRDLRGFARDILARRCESEPSGKQVRPGVWLDDGAEVHRRARIVAPAYVGVGSKVQADALLTRLTTVEGNCFIDTGTVIEDSSILENTVVGVCLDLCRSVASGNSLLNLDRDVIVELSDPRILRSRAADPSPTRAARQVLQESSGGESPPVILGQAGASPVPAKWRLENI
jgi:hypothetical protein